MAQRLAERLDRHQWRGTGPGSYLGARQQPAL